ncbi:ATP-binding protein [Streptomyces sp. NPDC088560]|uniref:ATP-binding protein n=1 Tax=Streptomyces sp. NPDC088560 TaxID=3365868 RepID=UPI00380D1B2E
MEHKAVGELLREARQRALLTLEALAEASGVSVRAVSDMERGRSVPRQSTLTELLDALGVEEAERRAFADAVRRAGGRATRTVPRQLPPDLRAFQGREAVMAQVEQLTAEAGERPVHTLITAVGGMAGIGKTSLAVHWAHRVADRFPHGQLYVNLRGFDPSADPAAPGEALAGFLTALGVPVRSIPDSTEERSAVFRQRTSGRRLIVVLDNARDSEQVRPLLPRSAGCLTLITSRNHLIGLAATDEAHLIDLDLWTDEEALEALAARMGPERVAAEPTSAAQLVDLCGRLPLAVAILAAHLAAEPSLPLRVAADELVQAHSRLDAFITDDPRTDVRAVFSQSYQALDPAAARFFRHLAVIPGPVLSAEAAASAVGEPMSKARGLLRTLTAASLLTRDAEGRYVLHDLIRAHASDLLHQEQEDRFAAELRLYDYLRHHARMVVQKMKTRRTDAMNEPPLPGVVLIPFDTREEALAWFQQEQQTIMAVLNAADDPRLQRLRMDLAHDCIPYFSAQGQFDDEVTALRLGLEAALLLDDSVGVGRTAINLARALVKTGQSDEIEELIRLTQRQFESIPSTHQAHALRGIGWVRYHQERYAEALDHSRAALAIYQTMAERDLVARELNAVGWYLAHLGRYGEAVASCREAVPILQEEGNRFSEAVTWDTIGYALYHSGELREAVQHFQTALQLYDDVPDPYTQAQVLDHLAQAQLDLGERHEACANWTRAAEMLEAIGHALAIDLRSRAQAAKGAKTGA